MSFVFNQWYAAVWSHELNEKPVARRLLGKPVVLFRGNGGSVAALVDACPHRFVPLSMGSITPAGTIRCGYHGLEFDGAGACTRNPHTNGRVPPAARARCYSAVERHGMVWVWMGQAAADERLIPDFSILDSADPLLTSVRACIQIDANYALIVENLLDLSHVGVLHEGLLGNEDCLSATLSVEEVGGDILVHRDMYDIAAPEMLDLLYKADGQRLDHWSDIRLMGVSCLLNSIGINDAGLKREGGTGMHGAHMLTPIDATRTLYHFCAVRTNPVARPEGEDLEIRRKLSELRSMAFSEQDGPMIRAQQMGVDDPAVDTSRPALFDVDAAASRFQRRLREMLAAERH